MYYVHRERIKKNVLNEIDDHAQKSLLWREFGAVLPHIICRSYLDRFDERLLMAKFHAVKRFYDVLFGYKVIQHGC